MALIVTDAQSLRHAIIALAKATPIGIEEIRLSFLVPGSQYAGAYTRCETQLPKSDVRAFIKLWRMFTQLLSRRFTARHPLLRLAIHSSAARWISMQANKCNTRKESTSQMLRHRARKTHITHLTVSGQAWHDDYWPWLVVSEGLTIRGCSHNYDEILWSRLVALPSRPRVLQLVSRTVVSLNCVPLIFEQIAFAQRLRHLIAWKRFVDQGGDKTKFPAGAGHFETIQYSFVAQEQYSPSSVHKIQNAWKELLPERYTIGTELVLDPDYSQCIRGPKKTMTIPQAELEWFADNSISAVDSTPGTRSSSGASLASSGSDATLVDEGSSELENSTATLVDELSGSLTFTAPNEVVEIDSTGGPDAHAVFGDKNPTTTKVMVTTQQKLVDSLQQDGLCPQGFGDPQQAKGRNFTIGVKLSGCECDGTFSNELNEYAEDRHECRPVVWTDEAGISPIKALLSKEEIYDEVDCQDDVRDELYDLFSNFYRRP